METPKSTIIIEQSHSTCANCHKETLVEGVECHDVISGYSGGGPGCGIRFTHITAGNPLMGSVGHLRPDLIECGYESPYGAPETQR